MKVLLIILLVLSCILNIYLLVMGLNPVKETKYEIPGEEMQLIRQIAVVCGTDESKTSKMSANEMLSDTENFIKSAESCHISAFTKEEITLLDSYLNDQKTILDKVKRQNSFIESLRGHRYLTLPSGKKE